MILPIIFIGIVLIVSSNYRIKPRLVETNSLNHLTILEENKYMIPFVLQKYYMNVIDVTSYLFPSLLSTSFWHENTELKKEKEIKIKNEYIVSILKKIGLFLSIILYGLIMLSWFKHSPTMLDYQLLTDTGSKGEIWNLNIKLGLDGLSLPFVLLVGFIMPIVYLSNWSTIDTLDVYYIIIIILLELFLITVFLVIDLIMFYVFFESILPPLFVLIGLYGASQKFRAGYYLFLYTLFGSLFMLVSFVKMGGDTATTFFEGYGNKNTYELLQEIMWIVLFVSFSVKTPLVPVHIWLPLAHSDANVSGSIILASIVLKLALYGFIRILIGIFAISTVKLIPFFFGLCSLSVLYSSFTTIRQFDLKVLVAYSSIAHMASSLLGTFSNTLYGLVGSIIFGLAHGFVSPGLFILVGAVLYDRCGSRIINYYRGLTNLLPLFALLFLVFVFGNMGVPLTGNFIGEFLSLLGAYQQNIFIASIGATSVILSAVYSIFMYNRVTGGSLSPYIYTIPDIFRKEFYILLPLLVLTLILGIYPSFITYDIEFGLSNYLLFSFFPTVLHNNNTTVKNIQSLHTISSNSYNTYVAKRELPLYLSENSNNNNEIDDNLDFSDSPEYPYSDNLLFTGFEYELTSKEKELILKKKGDELEEKKDNDKENENENEYEGENNENNENNEYSEYNEYNENNVNNSEEDADFDYEYEEEENDEDENEYNSDSSSSTVKPPKSADSDGYEGDNERESSWLDMDSDSEEEEESESESEEVEASKGETDSSKPIEGETDPTKPIEDEIDSSKPNKDEVDSFKPNKDVVDSSKLNNDESNTSKPTTSKPTASRPTDKESNPSKSESVELISDQSNPNEIEPIISQPTQVRGRKVIRPITQLGDSDGDQYPALRPLPPRGRESDEEHIWIRGSRHKEWWGDPSNSKNNNIIYIDLNNKEKNEEIHVPEELSTLQYGDKTSIPLSLLESLTKNDYFNIILIDFNTIIYVFLGLLAFGICIQKQYYIYLKIKQLYNEYPLLFFFKIKLFLIKMKEKLWK